MRRPGRGRVMADPLDILDLASRRIVESLQVSKPGDLVWHDDRLLQVRKDFSNHERLRFHAGEVDVDAMVEAGAVWQIARRVSTSDIKVIGSDCEPMTVSVPRCLT